MKLKDKKQKNRHFANNCLQESAIFFILGLFCVICPQSVLAEEFNMNNMPPPEAGMQYSTGPLQKGSSVTIEIVIPDNWHVNANIAADEFLKPSSIEISAKGVHFHSWRYQG